MLEGTRPAGVEYTRIQSFRLGEWKETEVRRVEHRKRKLEAGKKVDYMSEPNGY